MALHGRSPCMVHAAISDAEAFERRLYPSLFHEGSLLVLCLSHLQEALTVG